MGMPLHFHCVLWVHSGGVDPATGLPNVASRLRLERLAEAFRLILERSQQNCLVVFSGGKVASGGDYVQAICLERYAKSFSELRDVQKISLAEDTYQAYRAINRTFRFDRLICVVDDVHVSSYALALQQIGSVAYATVEYAVVDTLKSPEYQAAYPQRFVAGYAMARLLPLAWPGKALALFPLQFPLFVLDRMVKQRATGGVKGVFWRLVKALLPRDMRG